MLTNDRAREIHDFTLWPAGDCRGEVKGPAGLQEARMEGRLHQSSDWVEREIAGPPTVSRSKFPLGGRAANLARPFAAYITAFLLEKSTFRKK